MFGRRLKLAAGSIATLGTIYSFNNVEEEFTGVARHFATVYTVGKIIRNYKNIEQFASKSDCHLQCAHELLDLFKRNGGVYVKIGQHMSSLVHLIPQEYTDTMQVLQNACLASSYESLNRVFKEDYGKDIESAFKSFDKTPIGVASLAQVHLAEYQIPGTSQVLPVAVKIQHSYLKKQAEIDIKLCELLSHVVKKIFPGYELDWLASETAINLPLELSFENEHKNTLKCQENFKGFSGIIIPKVYYSSSRILIMQFEQGCKITDLKELELMNVDGRKVSYLLFKIYNEMIFKHNFVHCDPHPGNLLVQKRQRRWYQLFDTRNFNIVLLDHGLYRKLDPLFIKDYARFWISIIRGDERMIDRYAYQIFTHNGKPDHGTIKHHRLFASMVSGRSWSAISNKNGSNGIMARRAQTEVESVQANASDSRFFEAITIVLSKCPRELLLIIKTNDLIRSIDERLSGSSPSQMKDIMLLLAWYCKSVYQYKNYDSDRSEFQNFINDLKLTLVLVFARLWPIT